jgi:hypothetical protein
VPEKNDDILAQFQEFLSAKAASEAESSQAEDYEVEIWDDKGRGARVRRSHAKPFLQSLGIDLDAESDGDEGDKGADNGDGTKPAPGRKSTGKQSGNVATGGLARKYFIKPTGK